MKVVKGICPKHGQVLGQVSDPVKFSEQPQYVGSGCAIIIFSCGLLLPVGMLVAARSLAKENARRAIPRCPQCGEVIRPSK